MYKNVRVKRIKTRDEAYSVVIHYDGCSASRAYILSFHRDAVAKSIWQQCENVEWLFWLGYRWNPAVALAYTHMCLLRIRDKHRKYRSISEYRQFRLKEAWCDYNEAVNYLKDGQLIKFYSSIRWAFSSSLLAAPKWHREERLRLDELRRMW